MSQQLWPKLWFQMSDRVSECSDEELATSPWRQRKFRPGDGYYAVQGYKFPPPPRGEDAPPVAMASRSAAERRKFREQKHPNARERREWRHGGGGWTLRRNDELGVANDTALNREFSVDMCGCMNSHADDGIKQTAATDICHECGRQGCSAWWIGVICGLCDRWTCRAHIGEWRFGPMPVCLCCVARPPPEFQLDTLPGRQHLAYGLLRR